MIQLVLDNILLLCLIIFLEVVFRLIPTKRPLNLLNLVARLLAKLSILLVKLSKLLPENRR